MAILPKGMKMVPSGVHLTELCCYPYESRPEEKVTLTLMDGHQDSCVSTLLVHRAVHAEIKRLCRSYGVEAGACVPKVKPLEWMVYFYPTTSDVQNIGIIRFFRMNTRFNTTMPYPPQSVWMLEPYYLDPQTFDQDYKVVIKDRLLDKRQQNKKYD